MVPDVERRKVLPPVRADDEDQSFCILRTDTRSTSPTKALVWPFQRINRSLSETSSISPTTAGRRAVWGVTLPAGSLFTLVFSFCQADQVESHALRSVENLVRS